MSNKRTQILAEIALFASLAFILDILTQPLKAGPWISFSFKMVPIFILAFRWGHRPACTAGFLWGLLQIMMGQAYILNAIQVLLEYLLAFALIGTAGLLKTRVDNSRQGQKKVKTLAYILVGVLLGSTSRYLVHFIAGIIFWGSYAPEGSSAIFYSLTVNGSSWLGESLVCCLSIVLIHPLIDFLLSQSKSA